MRKKTLVAMVMMFLCLSVYAQHTRLVIGDEITTLVERVFEVELVAGVGEVELPIDSLTMQALSESVVLQDTANPPKVTVVSQVLHRSLTGRPGTRPAWVLDVPAPGVYTLKLSYLVNNIKWTGAYNFFVDADMSAMTLEGAISIQNHTDESFDNAEVFLTRCSMAQPFVNVTRESISMPMGSSHAGFMDKDLIALGAVALLDASTTTNLPLFNSVRVDIQPFLQYTELERHYHAHPPTHGMGAPDVWWHLEMTDVPENRLGIPLPKGTVRVYQNMEDGAVLCFSGNIETIAPGQPLHLNLASEPGIIVSRQVEAIADESPMRGSRAGLHTITLKNKLEKKHEVRVFTRLPMMTMQQVTISDASHLYKTHDNGFTEFRVEIVPGAQEVISFKASM